MNQRIALGIQYIGERYAGWQKQPGQSTIQGELEKALSFVADHPVQLVAAGRTDQGVHATGQVAHFDASSVRSEQAWVCGANTRLPRDIRIVWARLVPDSFHARFSALSRTYIYQVWNDFILPPFWYKRALLYSRNLNIDSMNRSGSFLIGEHDFSSFRGQGCQSKSPMRCLHRLEIEKSLQSPMISFTIEANAFLHHMVRNMVGLLLEIGRGRYNIDHARFILEAKQRKLAPAMVPPDGLYLELVRYSF